MRFIYLKILLFCMVAGTIQAQETTSILLKIGDPAPPLHVREWIKGTPIQDFEKGHVYVVEFWATWCIPCIAAMPHLSELARQYKDKVTIIGMDIHESKTTSLRKVKAFVDSMGNRMDYTVAAEDSNFMVAQWIEASGEGGNGIPRTFVVDAEGKLAWIGHPKELAGVLTEVVKNTWDIEEYLAIREEEKYLISLDTSIRWELNKYTADPLKPGDLGKPDSALLFINETIRKEPKLKYAPIISHHTFSSLLKTNPSKAYIYGKELLATPTRLGPTHNSILGPIKWYSDKLNIPAEIYLLGAEVYQMKIDRFPQTINVPNNYRDMAEMYWRAKEKAKAADAMQKAIDALKSKKDFSKTEMATFESKLKQYKTM